MTHLPRSLRLRAGVFVSSVAIAASGIALVTSTPAVAGNTPAPLDHFLCYHATESGLKAPANVLIKNIIQPTLFAPQLGAASVHCNPANKAVPTGVFTAGNPLAHLLCFSASYTYKPVVVNVTNQFGKATLKTTGGPNSLCLPTWKDNVSPPSQSPNQPPKLDHFTCYNVLPYSANTYGLKAPVSTKVLDEFSAPNYVGEKIGTANGLCVPTTKIVKNGVYSPQTDVDLSLLCFPGASTPIWKVVYDQNQFGTGKVFPTNLREELCLPTTVALG
jgi:hypothetical protein